MSVCQYLLKPSSYLMVLELREWFRGRVGVLGSIELEPGFYVYVGSARGGALARLRRYCSRSFTRPKWHIDYLLRVSRINKFYIVLNAHESELAMLLAKFLKIAFPFTFYLLNI